MTPKAGLVGALVVLAAGIVAAATTDSSRSPASRPISTTTTMASASSSTTSTTSSVATTQPTTTVAARPAVPTPEAAANGLWAAYSANNKTAAARFASPEVVDALFSSPFSGEEGQFESCRQKSAGIFDCGYSQPSRHYTMTAQADDNRSFQVVVIVIESTGSTTTDSFSR